jgi:hypothetical protein
VTLGLANVGPEVVLDPFLEIALEGLALSVFDVAVDSRAVRGDLDLVASEDLPASSTAVFVIAVEDVAVEIALAIFLVLAIVTVTVTQPVVGHGVVVTIVDEQSIVVDTVEQINHLVDGELPVLIVIEERVEGLKLHIHRT